MVDIVNTKVDGAKFVILNTTYMHVCVCARVDLNHLGGSC